MSTKFIARLLTVGIGKETVRGGGAASVYSLPNTKLSFDDVIKQARSVGSLGNIADSEEAFVVTKYGSGDIEGEIRAKSFGLILYAMMGSYGVAGPTDSAYTHTFTLAQTNTHQSLSFVINDPNHVELYPLVMLNSLEFDVKLDAVAMFKAAFMSKTARDTGLTVPAVVHESKFTKKQVNVKLASNIAGLSGAAKLAIKSLTFKIAKNVEIDDFLGTAEPEDIVNKQLVVEGDLELNYVDETYKNYMLNGTYQAMEIDFKNLDDLIGASSHPSLTFQMPKVDFNPWTPAYDNDKITTQKVSFKCSRDVANNLDVISSCVLVNDVVSY